MRLRFTRSDELLPHFHRERQIGKPTAMQMAELAASDTKLDASEAMR